MGILAFFLAEVFRTYKPKAAAMDFVTGLVSKGHASIVPPGSPGGAIVPSDIPPSHSVNLKI